MILYASELAAKALRIAPVGSEHTGPACVCGLCQRPIHVGDLSAPMAMPRTFMDYHKTARSAYVCGFCQATTQQTTMRALQRACITADGIYNLGKDESRAWFWLTPPEPPYAVVINHSTLGAFHYFWRTPVTLDNRLVQLNVDGTVYDVRRQRVQKALGYAQTILQHLEHNPPKGVRGKINSPFAILSREPSVAGQNANGHLLPFVAALRTSHPQFIEALDFLDTLTPGELLALSPTLKKNPSAPVQPECETSL